MPGEQCSSQVVEGRVVGPLGPASIHAVPPDANLVVALDGAVHLFHGHPRPRLHKTQNAVSGVGAALIVLPVLFC